MSSSSRLPILQGKHAVVFGAGGSIRAAVAKEFAAEGAEVFLAGRTKSNVAEVTKQITTNGTFSRPMRSFSIFPAPVGIKTVSRPVVVRA